MKENKKCKNKKIILGVAILLLLIIGIVVEFAISKYVTDITGSSISTTAKWKFKSSDDFSTKPINLNDTIKRDTVSVNKIAPGSNGSFDIVIDTTGCETAVDYEVLISNEINKPVNLLYNIDGNSKRYATLQELLDENVNGTIGVNDGKIRTFTIKWAWDYSTSAENDILDTKYATSSNLDYTFDINIIGTQAM
ncbi:MAG: hypothetical protein RR144_01740 [Clostridia bacterium]